MYVSVAEGGGREAESGLRLEGMVCSMLLVMLGGDLDIGVRGRCFVVTRGHKWVLYGSVAKDEVEDLHLGCG